MKLQPISAFSNNQDDNTLSTHQHSEELKVTKISKQAKRTDRFSVYINNSYSFSLNEYQLASSRLTIGKILTPNEVENFANESQFGKAYERALNYVMIRPRSEKEIKDYLVRTFLYPKPKMFEDKNGQKHFKRVVVDKVKTQSMIERVMHRLNDKGYINDEQFTNAWLSSRQLTKKSSIRKLKQELLAKGIDLKIIEKALADGVVNEKANLHELIVKKQRLQKYKDTAKLIQYLLRQGYNYDDIKEVLEDGEVIS